MAELKYTFKTDTLFKMIFVEHPLLLQRLVAKLLSIQIEDIKNFAIKNPEIPPEILGGKFCRLDISMVVNGQLVDLEIQVRDEDDYPERTLYHWAREYSAALVAGKDYSELPRVIVISIVAFPLFDCAEFHSEYLPLEATRHTLLTNRMSLHYFELTKLPEVVDAGDELKLWLALFKANTEEELLKLESIGGEVMVQAVEAYRHISATEKFMALERMREDMRHNEVAALNHARRQGQREGLSEGLREGEYNKAIKTARAMRAEGMDVNVIARITDLTVDDILRL